MVKARQKLNVRSTPFGLGVHAVTNMVNCRYFNYTDVSDRYFTNDLPLPGTVRGRLL